MPTVPGVFFQSAMTSATAGSSGSTGSTRANLSGWGPVAPRPQCCRRTGTSETWPAWLGEEPADEAQLKSFLSPYPSDEMICWPVSARVGNVKNNDPSLVEPIAAE